MTSIPMTTEYVDVKVKIGAVEFTNEELQIDSIKISNGCYDGSVFGIGNVYIKNANITMNYRDGITKGLSMEIFFEYQGAWISFGKFVVTETPVMSGDKLSVSLESEFGQTVSTSVDFTSTLQEYTLRDIKTKIEEITGKPIIFVPELTTDEEKSFLEKTACFLKNITDYVNQSGIKTGISVRDMLSGIAILFGGNAYEDTNNKIIIKQKTYYKNSNRYVPSDYLDSNYKYSQEIYAVRLVTLTFLPWCLGLYNPPNASGRICTVNYLGEDKVSNTLLASQSSMDGKTPYDYTIDCDWVGWTSDGSTFDTNVTPGGRASACLRQGDLMYRTCDMTFVGIDFGWNIAPGNLIKVKVPELENPIDVLCGEISYEWDGGFTTSISCNCNIESNGSYSTQVSTQASAVAAQEGRKTNLELNYANITFSNIEDSTIRGSIFKDGTIDGSKIKDSTITGSLIADSTIKGSNIEEGTITGSKIKAATITGALIVDGTIRGNHIMESSIDGSKIEDSAITESKISNSSITNSKIKDGTIENSKIKDATLTGSKIENSTLTNDLFKDGTIENSKIKDATLTGAKIQDATIGFEKVNVSFIKDLTADKAYIDSLSANVASISTLKATDAIIKNIFSQEIVANKAILDVLQANIINAEYIKTAVADVGYITADSAIITELDAGIADINTLIFGSATGTVIQTEFANSVIAHLGDAQIKSAMIESVSAWKITAGTIYTDDVTIQSKSGNMLLSDNTIQISDGTRARVQIGKDASNDYSINIWDESGNLMFSKGGITDSAIKSAIIRNDMVSDNANISAKKLDIDSLFSAINNDGSHTLKSTKIYFDDEGQTLDVSFKEMSTYVDNLQTIQRTQGTQISTIQGQINSKVWQQDITTAVSPIQENISTLNTKYAEVKQTADGLSTTVASHTTQLQSVDNKLTTNLLKPPTFETSTHNGVTFTNNGNGTYTLNGYSTGTTILVLGNVYFESGKLYRLVGWNNSIVGIRDELGIFVNGIFKFDLGDGTTFTVETSGFYDIDIVYKSGNTFDNFVIKPMITTNLNATYDDFVPYTGSTGKINSDVANNHKLTETVKTIAEQTADKFSWLVKSGTSATNFELTDRVASLLSEQFNIDALTTFKNSAENGTSTVINGGAIKAKTIKASSIDVDNLFAQDITATGTITGATLVGAKIYSKIGEIAGFTLKDQTLVSEFTQTDISNSVWDFKNEINSKANSEKHFITATRTGHESGLIANKACFGIDGVLLNSFNKGDDYYDKFMHLSERILAFGVNSATPYNGSSIAFEIDSGYAPIYGSGEFTINPSCVINVPTTVNNNLTVTDTLNTYKAEVKEGIEIYHPSSTPYIDFHNSPYGQGSSDYDFRIILHDKNMLSFENYYGSVFRIHDALVYENGYSLIGCTITTSGNFTCKKYRDGRLIIEFRFKTTSNVSLSNKSETYYATGPAATFPIAFTDVPSVISGLGIANSQAPFCNVTFDSVTKTGFGRYIIWTLPTISGYVIPSGSVVSATFTGRWK